ncbi:MAG TPA: D-alanine--D-alanine ligase [Planctomycetota bacterium]|nr:D-alanine--D-alanine ligase [Planctomycetota bacterium]
MRIGLTYNLRSDYLAQGYPPEVVAEFDSDETILALEQIIGSLGHQTDRIGNVRALCARLAAGDRWDLVFNIAEGLSGRCRESQVPAILEAYGQGYTFSDPLTCAATLDKAVAKRLIQAAGLPTPGFHVVETPDDIPRVSLAFPLFAKPLAEGTSKGITDRSVIDTPEQLNHACRRLLADHAQPVLVEEYLPGREFTAGIVGTGHAARVIGVMEIEIRQPSGAAVYSYETKEQCEQLVKYSRLDACPLRDEVNDLALKAYRALECRDAARVDIRCDRSGKPCFIEVNPLPGLHPTHSDLPMIATQEGISYARLIESIIRNAATRLGKT